jgi:hypothetical protein
MSTMAWTARILVGSLFVVHGIAFVWQSPKLRLGSGDVDAPLTPKQARCLGAAELAWGLVFLLMPAFGGSSALTGAAAVGMGMRSDSRDGRSYASEGGGARSGDLGLLGAAGDRHLVVALVKNRGAQLRSEVGRLQVALLNRKGAP